MGLFDFFHKKTKVADEPCEEVANTDFEYEAENLIFKWNKEPENVEEIVKPMIEAYKKNLNHIAEEIFKEVKDIFGVQSVEQVTQKLGRPIIDVENGIVSYCKHTMDDVHIIDVEFSDDNFSEIQFVSING